jgi:two-component system chemotaxis response regulator CheY
MRLLVVDDSDVSRRAIRRSLQETGDHVEVASNGVEALRVLESFDPDVITMDLSMPEMDGLDCISAIVRLRPKARILVISALADKPTAVEAVVRGASGFLLKPFHPSDLRFEIDDLVAGRAAPG